MYFAPELITEDISFGELTITKIYDGRDREALPLWAIEIRKGEILISRIVGAGFDDYAISQGESIFVGISNSGYPDTAYLVVDRYGALLSFKRHLLPTEMYCQLSVSALREWYDSESPDIHFRDVGNDAFESIPSFSVRGCDGGRIDFDIQ
tara:strand:+ start:142 stop:594 length:453 start_codon:yes stop_codon:yes gene_type:complete